MAKYCQHCKTGGELHINSRSQLKDGTIRINYMCKSCTNRRLNKYYHSGNQKRFIEANKRYRQRIKENA